MTTALKTVAGALKTLEIHAMILVTFCLKLPQYNCAVDNTVTKIEVIYMMKHVYLIGQGDLGIWVDTSYS